MKKIIMKSFRGILIFTLTGMMTFFNVPIPAMAGDLPSDPDVQIGNPIITVDQNEMTVDAGQFDKTWIDWMGGFNIGAENIVNNLGPSAAAAILHNDLSGAISNIQGILNGNCQVFLMNPNGILFSPTAQVNVNGFVASTLQMAQNDFINDSYILQTGALHDPALIINQGEINALNRGSVTLAAGAVRNTGTINANLGTINLVSGDKVTLNIAGDGSIQAAVSEGVLDNVYDHNGSKVDIGVDNVGALNANGGTIYIETDAVNDVFDTLINQEGIARAGSMVERDGKIVLVSDSDGIVQNTGTIDVSGIEDGASGGDIEVTGDMVGQFGEVYADAMGDADAGNIDIWASDVVALSSDSLTTANADVNGDGGEIIVFSPDTAVIWDGARLEAKGGVNGGDGGFIETSGKERLIVGDVYVSTAAPAGNSGQWLLDPWDVTISDSATGANIAGDPAWVPTGADANINIAAIEAVLDNNAGAVTVTTGVTGVEDGDITISDPIDVHLETHGGATTSSLTLTAAEEIMFMGDGNVTVTGDNAGDQFTLDLNAGTTVTVNTDITASTGILVFDSTSSGTFAVSSTGTIVTNGGSVTIVADDRVQLNAASAISSGAGNINITCASGYLDVINSGIVTTSGNVDIDLTSGYIESVEVSDATSNITTTGGSITLEASTGIYDSAHNAGLDIDSASGAVNLTNDGTGAVEVDYVSADADTVTLTMSQTGAGNITYDSLSTGILTLAASASANGTFVISNDAGISVSGVLNTSAGATDHLLLEALTGNIALGNVDNIITAGTGEVTVSALAGNITVADAAAQDEIVTTGTVVLTGAAIGATNSLSLNGATALTITDLDGAGSHIQIEELTGSTIAATTITAPTATSGNIDINYSGANVVDINNGHVLNSVDLSNATKSTFTYTATVGSINAVSVDTDTEDTTLTAAGNITTGASGSITADTLTLVTTGAASSIGTVSATPLTTVPLLIDAVTVNATTNLGHISIKDTADGIAVGAITTAGIKDGSDATRIILEAVGGDITDSVSDTTVDINAWTANLITSENTGSSIYGGAIGATGTAASIDTDVSVLNATADNGGIYIYQPDDDVDIILGNITAQSEGRTPYKNDNGYIVIATTGTTTSDFDIEIVADGDVFMGGLVTSPDSLSLTAADSISDSHDGNDFVADTLNLVAGGGGSIGIGQSANPLETTVETINATSSSDGVYITEGIGTTVGLITASGSNNDVTIVASTGNLVLGQIDADAITDAVVTVESTHGAITDNNAATANILTDGSAGTAIFIAADGIGTSAADADVDTTVAILSATTSTADTAGIYIDETDALTSITVETNSSDVGINYDPGVARTVSFDSQEDLSLSSADTGVTTFSFENTGGLIDLEGIGINTGSGVITLTASTAITQASGVLSANAATLTAGTNIGATGADAIDTTLTTLTSAVTTAGGVFINDTASDLAVTTVTAGGDSSDVEITSANNIALGAVTATGDDVTLTATDDAITDGNSDTVNITSGTLTVAAGSFGATDNEIETDVSTMASIITTANAGGVFISDTAGDVTITTITAGGTGSDVEFTSVGDVTLGAVTATDEVTLTATRKDITDGNADVAGDNVTAVTLNVAAGSFGASGNKIETDVTTLSSVVTSNGGVYIDENDGVTITTVTAGGNGDVDILSGGTILLGAITASGDDVTLKTTSGNITDNNAGSTNVTADTLTISASGTIGVDGDGILELDVGQIVGDGSGGGVNAAVSGKLALSTNSFQGVTSAVVLSADDITILDGTTPTMGAGGSIDLTANYGNIVFIDKTDTINSNGGTIILTANYTGTPPDETIDNVLPGRITIGNLTSGGGTITLQAYSDITIGHLNATAGTVNVTATNGLILDGNTGTTNITAGIANLTAKMHTAAATELDRENAIADYSASVAEANAKESLKNTWDSNYTTLAALVADTLTTKNASQSAYDSAVATNTTEGNLYSSYLSTSTTYHAVSTAAQIVKDIASFPSAVAQGVPLTGDGGAASVFAGIDLAFSVADAAAQAYDAVFLDPQSLVATTAEIDLSTANSNLESATLDYNNAVDIANAANGSLSIATADYNAAVIARDHAQEIRTQALASFNAGEAISELEIIAGTVNLTTSGEATGAANVTLTGATAVGLNTIGDISITNAASAHATLDLVTSDGDITYTQTGADYDVLIDVVTADTTDDTVTITSAGAIHDDVNDGTVDITAATITLSAGSDGVGQTNGSLDINATTALNVSISGAGNGSITINDTAGDLPIGTITAGSGTVALTSAGTIDDATSDTTADITAANLALTAATGIGAGEGIETVVSIYAATTTAGDMSVDNAGTLSVGTVAGVTGARITAGGTSDDIFIMTASPLTVDDAVLNDGGGNITLIADGTAASDKLTIDNTITASGGNGNITLYAGEDIAQGAFAITAAGSGTINYYAGVDYNSGTPQAGLSTGLSDITMNGTPATAVSTSGNITMTAPRNIVLGIVSTSGNVSMTADDSTYIASDSSGGISEVTADGTANITAATATLRAATGIGSGDDIETNITTLDVLNSISGNIDIAELAAGGALGINRATQSALGNITIQTLDGTLTVTAGQSGVSLTTGALLLNAGDSGASGNDNLAVNAAIASTTGKVNLDATNDVIFGAAGDVTTTSGEIEVAATDAITMVDGTVLDAGNDLIDLDADENIALGSLVTINDTATAIDINTANGAVTDANSTSVNITSASGEATIKAQTGVDTDTTLGTIDVINDASGTININETDGLLINRIVQTLDGPIVVTTAGATTVVAAGGGVTTDASGATGDSISITVAGDSSLTVNDAVLADNGTITLVADDDVIFSADGDVDAGVGAAGTDGDTVTITADNDSDASGTGGAVTLVDGTLIDAGDGTIDVNADENIALGGLVTTNAAGSAVTITSTSGAVTDAGNTHTDIDADEVGALVTIDAVTGVGNGNALETEVATIDIDNDPGVSSTSVTANIEIVELLAGGGLIVKKAVQGDIGVDAKNSGDINISTQDGTLTVIGSGTGITARDGGTITLIAANTGAAADYDVVIGKAVTSSVGLKDVGVDVVYAGNITLTADNDVDVDAKVSTANANADYTANGDIDLTATNGDALIDAEIEVVGSGNITIDAANDALFGADGDITAVTGNVTVTADSDGGGAASGALTMNDGALINAGSGTIALNADEAITLGGLLTTNSTNTAVVLTSTEGGVVDGGATFVDVVATLGRLVIDAVTGVGSGGNIDTTVASIDIDNTTSGNIDINETNAISVNQIDQDGTGTVNLDAAGIITVTAGTGLGVTATSGTVELDANGTASDVIVNEQVITTTGTVNVLADNDVTFGVDGDVTSGGAGNIAVTADADSVADGSSGAITMADASSDSAIISAGTGTITLLADEDITLGGLTTNNIANSSIIITSGNGAIVDGGDTAVDIDANTTADTSGARITAETGIGTDADSLETTIETLSATTVTGDIHVVNTGDLQIINSTVNGAQITGGSSSDNITILASSPLTVAADVVDAGGGSIILAAEGTTAGDDLTINDVITASGGNGNITLYAGNTITHNGVAVTAAGSGTVNYYAGVDYNSGTPQAGLSTGLSDITMAAAATAVSGSGNITMTAPGSIALSAISTTGNATVTADDTTYIVSNSIGAITESAAEGTANITAATATLRAATGVGSADDIETNITALDVLNSISSNINITELAAGGALGINRATQSALGDITIQTLDGTLTVTAGQNGVSLTTGALLLNAADAGASGDDNLAVNAAVTSTTGKVNLDASNDVTFGAAGDVTTTSGEIEVAATDAITMTDGAVLDAGDDQIDMDADEDITLGGLTTVHTADDAIAVTSVSGGIVDGGDTDVDIVANTASATVDLDAATGIGSANALETTIYNLEANNTTSGDIKINETDAINLVEVLDNITGGDIELESGGDITSTTVTAGNGVTLYANGGNIYDTAGGLITAGASSSLKATGIIGTALVPYNPVDVDITGDLWVGAGEEQNGISVILQGAVRSPTHTERVEIYSDPIVPPGIVMLNNHLMGGSNYGSGSANGSILSVGYGALQQSVNDTVGFYNSKNLQPWGYQNSSPWINSMMPVIDNNFLNGPMVIVDGSQVGVIVVPEALRILPPRFSPDSYYVIRSSKK
ncbi:MAG: filamentous hemagglutinin N-terminal domain-containing protein [Candidatus Gorgyraea atricola]|nr:filamentous hemagglutinin N-terminal domain-containing protein [Candidatus Gorgyraea atricola]